MKLTKTTKKLDNHICKALTRVCEDALHDTEGFSWLTHRVDYTNFPASLMVTCVFESEAHIKAMHTDNLVDDFRKRIQAALLSVAVVMKTPAKNIRFDSEEACSAHHAGHWDTRLALKITKQKPTHSRSFTR